MFDGGRVLAVITARGGSKGLPGKNIRLLSGRPLLGWSVLAAATSRYIDRIVVSTDSEEIAGVARAEGAETPFLRPAELARDESNGVDPVLHALGELPGFDWVVLLQPTSPLRVAEDIDACFDRLHAAGSSTAVSVCRAQESPHLMYRVTDSGRSSLAFPLTPTPTRRQDLPKYWVPNGAVYLARVDALLHARTFYTDDTVLYEMPLTRSIDIDTEEDFRLAAFALSTV